MERRVFKNVVLTLLMLTSLGAQAMLTDPSFEVGRIRPLSQIVNPLTPTWWGVENATRVGPENGIIPWDNSWMLRMEDDGLAYTQAFQFVDIGTSPPPLLKIGAWFNSNAPAADGYLRLLYYASATGWGSPIGMDTRLFQLDNDLTTWEGVGFFSPVPQGATWVGVEIGFRNDSIRPTYFGYVDDVRLEAAIPEPATGVALGVLAAVALLRRRGRQS